MADKNVKADGKKDAGETKPKRVYVRRNASPLTVYEVVADGKALGLFLSRKSADSFAVNAGNIAAAIGGKLGKTEVMERIANP